MTARGDCAAEPHEEDADGGGDLRRLGRLLDDLVAEYAGESLTRWAKVALFEQLHRRGWPLRRVVLLSGRDPRTVRSHVDEVGREVARLYGRRNGPELERMLQAG